MNTGGPASNKTLLDEFAGQAMMAITISALSENTKTGYSIEKPDFLECLSLDAYAHAEAMIKVKARFYADHSPDARKMAEINRELLEALEVLVCGAEKVQKKGYAFAQLDVGVVMARDAIAKAKEAKP